MDKIPVWWYIIGIPASAGLDVNVRRLWNRILAQSKIAIVYSIFNKNRSSGTYCVVTLFKAKVISRVKLMWNISLPDFRIQFVTLLKSGIYTMFNVPCKVKNDNVVLDWIQNCNFIFDL